MKWMITAVMAGVLNFVTPGAFAGEVDTALDIPIGVFHEVAPGIYRGGRPGHSGMAALAKLGVKTDIDLENNGSAIADESAEAKALGIRIVSKPMSGFFAPSDQTVDEILALMSDSANFPIFVHCQHGQDRTGLIVGLYRVFNQEWTPSAAYAEMKQIGFHPLLIPLNHYFETRTGYDD